MEYFGGGRNQHFVHLKSGLTCNFNYVANCSYRHLVFADFELDSYVVDFSGCNLAPRDPSHSLLKRHGQLPTHGNYLH